MAIRDLAIADTAAILSDVAGSAVPVDLINPDGNRKRIGGHSADIGRSIDPQTGLEVSARAASVTIPIRCAEGLGPQFGMPRGEPDSAKRPWRVEYRDAMGVTHFYKVREVLPDRTVGAWVLLLEPYNPTTG